jgi:hypothetical protein
MDLKTTRSVYNSREQQPHFTNVHVQNWKRTGECKPAALGLKSRIQQLHVILALPLTHNNSLNDKWYHRCVELFISCQILHELLLDSATNVVSERHISAPTVNRNRDVQRVISNYTDWATALDLLSTFNTHPPSSKVKYAPTKYAPTVKFEGCPIKEFTVFRPNTAGFLVFHSSVYSGLTLNFDRCCQLVMPTWLLTRAVYTGVSCRLHRFPLIPAIPVTGSICGHFRASCCCVDGMTQL